MPYDDDCTMCYATDSDTYMSESDDDEPYGPRCPTQPVACVGPTHTMPDGTVMCGATHTPTNLTGLPDEDLPQPNDVPPFPNDGFETIKKIQYSPSVTKNPKSQAQMIDALTAYSQEHESVSDQSPDGFGKNWSGTEWNGVSFNPEGKSKAEICAFIRPNSQEPLLIRGLKEKFNEIQPFDDVTAPTVAEIDNWNTEVINHFRNLLGNGSTPIKPSARLHLEAFWSSERFRTPLWDMEYPEPGPNPARNNANASGPCWLAGSKNVGSSGSHCGDAFFPINHVVAAMASAPYNDDIISYPELENYTTRYALSGGNSSAPAWLPWSVKLAKVIGDFVCTEGMTGHPGPLVGSTRAEYGISWWYTGGETTGFKGKYR